MANYRLVWFFAEPVALIDRSQPLLSSLLAEEGRLSPTEVGLALFESLAELSKNLAIRWPARAVSVETRPKSNLFRPGLPCGFPVRNFLPTEVDFSLGVGLLAKSVKRSVIRGRLLVSTWLIAEHMDMLGHDLARR